MKSKLETIIIVIVLIIDICLYNLNFGSKTVEKQMKSVEVENSLNTVKISSLLSMSLDIPGIIDSLKVYDNLTMEELSSKINKSLKSTLTGKGELIASYSLEKGVDPYMATAIILHETGCNWECSYLVKTCNNVGGQKGSGCGSYSAFPSLDEGIKAFIDNLSKNYVSKGLTTPELINPKYAASTTWAVKVNGYIAKIKAQ